MNVTADVTSLAHVTLRKVQKEGEEYLDVESIKWDVDTKGLKLHMNNLFNGDKTLGECHLYNKHRKYVRFSGGLSLRPVL